MSARVRRVSISLAVLAVLGLTFASYFDPHLMVDLATRVWACF